jgi:5-formyltetrahydrofolate cyclo-ligase
VSAAKRQKADLRSRIAAAIDSLGPEAIEARSAEATAHLFAMELFSAAAPKTVALYLSFPLELQTEALWHELERRGHRCVFPRVLRGSRVLEFSPLSPGDPVEAGPLGVREPLPGRAIDLASIDVFVVPGAAFDDTGGRLGRGGGYYDTTLATAPAALRVGWAFDEQLVEGIPMLPHDAPMDWVVTPSRTLRCPPRVGGG